MKLERFLSEQDFQLALSEREQQLHSWNVVQEQIQHIEKYDRYIEYCTVFYAIFTQPNS